MGNNHYSFSALLFIIVASVSGLTSCGKSVVADREKAQKETEELEQNAPQFQNNLIDEGYVDPKEEIQADPKSQTQSKSSHTAEPAKEYVTEKSDIVIKAEENPVSPLKPSELKKISTIRVKVFPHLNRYNTPHGRELKSDRFVIQSQGNCELRDEKGVIAKAKRWAMSTANVTKKVTVKCSDEIEIVRGVGANGKMLKNRKYEGVIEISPILEGNKKTLEAINVIDFEKYLKGVVPSEVDLAWDNLEAYKVQAIAARSYSYQVITRRRGLKNNTNYDLDDTVQFQAYTGITQSIKKTNDAVEATRDEVMTYDGKVIQAFFSSDAGGASEDARNAWNGTGPYIPYAIAKKDPFPRSALEFLNWTKEISTLQVKNLLRVLGLRFDGKLPSLEVQDDDKTISGRAKIVTLQTSTGVIKKRKIQFFEQDVGLKSRKIAFTSTRSPHVVSGKGYGHGVGLSQWGAHALTSAPYHWSYEKVLQYYYTDAVLTKLSH